MNTLLRKIACTVWVAGLVNSYAVAQETLTPNGIADQRLDARALTGASIYQPDGSYVQATLLLREGRVVGISTDEQVPDDFFTIDMSGRYIYPGLLDIHTDYGLPDLTAPRRSGGAETLEPTSPALNANDAIRSYYRASLEFAPDTEAGEALRQLGFSTVLSLRPDGIARGTSALVTLGEESAAEAILVPDVAAHYSLDRGSSAQSLPSSLMGAIALLRQTSLDADWFAAQSPRPFTDAALEAWISNRDLPQVIDVDNWQLALTMDRVGDELGFQFLIKLGTDGYQQASRLAATGAGFIVPVNYPAAPKVEDALDSDKVAFADLKHWELAPFNLRLLNEQGVRFAVTSEGAGKDFWKNLREAVRRGLPATVAIDALTLQPARMLGVEDQVGQLVPGALANLLITSAPLLEDEAVLLENWVRGSRYVLARDFDSRRGQYTLAVGDSRYTLSLDFVDAAPRAELDLEDSDDTVRVNMDLSDDLISLNFTAPSATGPVRLNGWPTDTGWQGNGLDAGGARVAWQLSYLAPLQDEEGGGDGVADEDPTRLPSALTYPFSAYGWDTPPQQQDMVIRNAMVWTNEEQGVLPVDVLVRDGRIVEVGPDLNVRNAMEIDGTGKHLTPGIIDEHSHIALFNINEGATNSSMVRMRDVVDAQDIDIYRNLAGGVVAAQLLHGSANPIGGQSAIIKMRWGAAADELLIEDAPPFIKFALGENVKRSTNPASIRYPQTRMGVEQVFMDAFSQAREYGRRWEEYNGLSNAARRNTAPPRRDLVDEAMLEILNGERYVTSHSYVQSEINMLMHVADTFDFNINTFTHILEGYKVADKMAAHGAGGSTFSDWWGYKWEVRYAIPYNAALMQQAGVVVAINSDDAEMSRRLNQEAAKAVKYGNVSEIDALKMVTLNPAKLLHLDERMGSIRPGKDADLVLWSDHPLSVYAVAETTWVDGIPYYDRRTDQARREHIASERARIIAAISKAANGGNRE
ncbi:MAG: hypothetical protein RLZZ385_1542 [Pseudomonadota bacterium]|jgi:imidazolonepropionase-like amidohydrolase